MRNVLALSLALAVAAISCGDDDAVVSTPPADTGGTPSFDSSAPLDTGVDAGVPDTGAPVEDIAEPVDIVPDVPAPEDIPVVDDVPEPEDTFVPVDSGPLVGICLLNNCHSDDECAGCTQNRTTCKLDENRCIACDPTTQTGCAEGEVCTGFGLCAPVVQTCATDGEGNPTIACEKNADCLACSPMHQVCDTADGQCKACTETNTSHCLQSQVCLEGRCSDKCPKACLVDNDCMSCGGAESPAHACFQHKCAQCSETFPCDQTKGEICEEGVCVQQCGIIGSPGSCQNDNDCQYCGGTPGEPGTKEAWACKLPINGATFGVCSPKAAGCSDLGAGVAVLPEPWSKGTNLCSSDVDCQGVGIQYNVGKLVKDLIGKDKIDLGFAEIEIQDASVNYAMNSCAAVDIIGDLSCGVCVPCKVDADCSPIPVDGLVFDLFKGEALVQIAGALLLDLLYGSEDEKNLNFWCQNIAAGYGVCLPCGNPLQPCGKSEEPPPGSGTCDHDVCQEGTALDPSCGACASSVCEYDSYCCSTAWDNVCVGEVDSVCTTKCGGGGGNICNHGPCEQGTPLSPQCSPCAAAVCKADAFCCNQELPGSWDEYCTQAATQMPECADQCAGGCSHTECTVGPALQSACSACAASVCAGDGWCCSNEWDKICVDEAAQDAACSCP